MDLIELKLRRVREMVCRSVSFSSSSSSPTKSGGDTTTTTAAAAGRSTTNRPCVTWADHGTSSPNLFRRLQETFRDTSNASLSPSVGRHKNNLPLVAPPTLLSQELDNRPSPSRNRRLFYAQSYPGPCFSSSSSSSPLASPVIRTGPPNSSSSSPTTGHQVPLDNRPMTTLQIPDCVSNHQDSLTSTPVSPSLAAKVLFSRPLSVNYRNAEMETCYEESDFVTDCIHWHNVFRERHQAPPLSLSLELCQYAQEWANHLAHNEIFYHRNPRNSGENLFTRWSCVPEYDITGREAVVAWYSGIKQYNFNAEPDLLHVNAGQFTQMVWCNTSELGVGKARARGGKILVVAYYRPQGNIIGRFKENVLPQISCSPSDDGSGGSEQISDDALSSPSSTN